MTTALTFQSRSTKGMIERPAYFIKDGLAVARPIRDDKYWMIGQVMTGMSLGRLRWRSKVKAKAALLEILPLTDWMDPRFKDLNAFFLGKNFYEKIRVIAMKHGAKEHVDT